MKPITAALLRDRVLAFFRRNPDEELNDEDIALKFDTLIELVDEDLDVAVQTGLLRRRRFVGRSLYQIGPNLLLSQTTPVAEPELLEAAATRKKKARTA